MSTFRPSGISVFIREDLAEGAARSGTTLVVDPIITKDGHRVTMANIGDIGFAKIDQGNDSEEIISFTGITDNTTTYTLTGVVWGYYYYSLVGDVDANKKRHNSGGTFIITNDDHFLASQYVNKDDFDPDSNTLNLGDGTDTDKTIYADNGDANKPFMIYDASENKWLISNNGVDTYDIAAGGSGLTAGLGIEIVASAIQVKLNASTKLVRNLGTGVDELALETDTNDALDGSSGTPDASNPFLTQDDTDGTGDIKRNSEVSVQPIEPNAGETIAGATLPVPVYQNKTDNEVYKCDGNDVSKIKFFGFATSDSTDGNPITVKIGGVVSGFTGLDEGEYYYLSNTAGEISKTTYSNKLVGIAVSATELLIMKNDPRHLIQDLRNPIPINKSITPFAISGTGLITVPTGQIAVITHWYATSSDILRIDDAASAQQDVLDGSANNAIGDHVLISPFLVDEDTDIATSAATGTAFGYYIDKDYRITPVTELIYDTVQYTVPANKIFVLLNVYSVVNTSIVSANLGEVFDAEDVNNMTAGTVQGNLFSNPIIFAAGDVLDTTGVGNQAVINGYLLDLSDL